MGPPTLAEGTVEQCQSAILIAANFFYEYRRNKEFIDILENAIQVEVIFEYFLVYNLLWPVFFR